MIDHIKKIKDAVVEGDDENVLGFVESALKDGVVAKRILHDSLSGAMLEVGELWNRGETFIPEVMAAADAFARAAERLESDLGADSDKEQLGTVILGTVEGDLHNLGKNLVSVMMKTGGFNVVDLGINVSGEKFIEEATRHNADIIGLSALLTTTMVEQQNLIDLLKEKNVRGDFKVMVGGAPISQEWAEKIGADGYARNAGEAVELAKKMMRQ